MPTRTHPVGVQGTLVCRFVPRYQTCLPMAFTNLSEDAQGSAAS